MLAVKEPLIVCTFCVEQVLFIKDAASFRINGDTVIDRTLAFRFQNKTNKARTVESDFIGKASTFPSLFLQASARDRRIPFTLFCR